MQEIIKVNNDEVVTMTSLEVIELINNFRKEEGNATLKRHDVLLRDIDNEIETLKILKIDAHNFVETSYKDSWNRNKRCYKMNKAGIMQMLNKESALVRYKTQQYIEALENKLKQSTKPLSAMELLKLQYQVIEEQDQKIEEVREDLNAFKEDIPLFPYECEEITKTVKKIGTLVLGGYGSKAYKNKSLRAKVYSDIHRQLKREFDVNSFKVIKRKHLKLALDIVENYSLTVALNEEVELMNSQVAFA